MSDSAVKSGMPPVNSGGQYVLVNAYEELIKSNVWDMIVKNGSCQCEKCYLDTCAIVLNNTRNNYVHYVTTHAGGLLMKVPEMNYSNQAEMTVIILNAIRKVSESPMHDF